MSIRWERLFDDLEARLVADEALDLAAEIADRTRHERAQVGLAERLSAMRHGPPVVVEVAGLGRTVGSVLDVGADWVLLEPTPQRVVLAPFSALRSLSGLSGKAGTVSRVARGFTCAAALRAISRDRAPVTVVDVGGARFTGTIDAVGQGIMDIAEHALDLPRRPENVRESRVVPLSALGAVVRD